jgi:cell division protein ZapE
MSNTRDAYQRLLNEGKLQPNPAQENAVVVLEQVEAGLGGHSSDNGLGRLLHGRPASPRGAYLWGPVGRGKSMLMDLFCEAVPIKAKRRVHFHAFMGEVQARLEALRQEPWDKDEDVVLQVADELARKIRLLCFDELEVTDIADAIILGRLFERLFDQGVVLVATSNEAPDDLYRDGINRQLFEPFIDLIKAHTTMQEIGGDRDYRLDRAGQAESRYLSPVTPETTRAFDADWRRQVSAPDPGGTGVAVHGRTIGFAQASGDKLRAEFAELCARDLGPDDYLALANRFRTVFLGPVPVVHRDQIDQARRFVILIDALYEAKAALWMLAAAEPDGLIELDDEATKRAVSRLNEMRSASWGAAP